MSKKTTQYVGQLEGYNKDEAATAVEKKWKEYRKAAELVGDVMMWQDLKIGGELSENIETIKNDFEYFTHEETEKYQEFAHTSTKTEKKRKEDGDGWYSEYYLDTEIYTPVTKIYTHSEQLKVVKRGQSKRVAELENEFLQEAHNYYDVKAGFSSKLPRKTISIVYNILLLFAGLFLSFFVLFSPAILPEYAQSLSVDIILFNLINVQGLPLIAPTWVCYITFVLGAVCLLATLCVKSSLSKFAYNTKSGLIFGYLIIVLVAFGLGFLMNDGYKDLMGSGNPLIWIPLILFCASRALSIILHIFAIIIALRNLITNNPHKTICQAIVGKADRLNSYIDSGRYQRSCDILQEISSLTVNNVADICDEIAKILTKINELNENKNKLIKAENTEFVDKSAEITELDIRINKAQKRINELCSNQ